MRGMTKDLSEIIETVRKQGWVVQETTRHFRLLPPTTAAGLVLVSKTPSDHRALKNIRSDIRRAGGAV